MIPDCRRRSFSRTQTSAPRILTRRSEIRSRHRTELHAASKPGARSPGTLRTGAIRRPPICRCLDCGQLAQGVHLVLGTVTLGPGLSSEAIREWCLRHVVQEGHPHVHGANFGIRADVYSALGGWQALACGEDDALAARATSASHLRIARTARIPVVTSTRLQARAPDGFSSYLRELVTPIDERTHEQLRIEVA